MIAGELTVVRTSKKLITLISSGHLLCLLNCRIRPVTIDQTFEKSPYLPWTISHLAPDYMEADLVGVVVFDIQKNMLPNVRLLEPVQ